MSQTYALLGSYGGLLDRWVDNPGYSALGGVAMGYKLLLTDQRFVRVRLQSIFYILVLGVCASTALKPRLSLLLDWR
jgi:hypothetical protein